MAPDRGRVQQVSGVTDAPSAARRVRPIVGPFGMMPAMTPMPPRTISGRVPSAFDQDAASLARRRTERRSAMLK